ncbi:hypothetical protein N9N67_05265 [Bacteriovoracaceae bacterium]|nr:hypothetical protein [Bacteriovoracaceae bacterium]
MKKKYQNMPRLLFKFALFMVLLRTQCFSYYFSPYGAKIPNHTSEQTSTNKLAKIIYMGHLKHSEIEKQVLVLKKTLELETFPHQIIGSQETTFHNHDNKFISNLPFQIYFYYFSPDELDNFYLAENEIPAYLRQLKVVSSSIIASLGQYLNNSKLNEFIQSTYFEKKYKLAGANDKINYVKSPTHYIQNMELQLTLFKSKLIDLIKRLKKKNKHLVLVLTPVDFNYPSFSSCYDSNERISSGIKTIKDFNQKKVTKNNIQELKTILEEKALKSCMPFSHPIIINKLLTTVAKQYGLYTIRLDDISFNREFDNNNTMGKIMAQLYKELLKGF